MVAVCVGVRGVLGEGSKPKVAVGNGVFVDAKTGDGVCVSSMDVADSSVSILTISVTDVDVGLLSFVESGFSLGTSNPTSATSKIARKVRLNIHPENLCGRNPKKKRVSTPTNLVKWSVL